MIEDLISTGGSSLKAVDALRDGGLEVKGLIAIFTYGFDVANANFANSECPYLTLSDYDTMVSMALDSNLISKDDLESLKDWRTDPKKWKQ